MNISAFISLNKLIVCHSAHMKKHLLHPEVSKEFVMCKQHYAHCLKINNNL